jgi:hypothetical protein
MQELRGKKWGKGWGAEGRRVDGAFHQQHDSEPLVYVHNLKRSKEAKEGEKEVETMNHSSMRDSNSTVWL